MTAGRKGTALPLEALRLSVLQGRPNRDDHEQEDLLDNGAGTCCYAAVVKESLNRDPPTLPGWR